MSKLLLSVLCVLGLLVAGPASADDVVGSEKEEQELDCPADGESVPENQEPPEDGECKDDPATTDVDESEGTYTGWVWTNEVTCDSDNQGLDGVLTGDATQSGTGGEMGLCTDGALPIHGRLVMGGSAESGGMYLYIDGDSSNEGPLSGWARVDAYGAPTVRCGDSDGRLDASEPTDSDAQDDCG